ncbi:MAG: hypothetical protein WDN24_14920 [Sphingomonas sp.]
MRRCPGARTTPPPGRSPHADERGDQRAGGETLRLPRRPVGDRQGGPHHHVERQRRAVDAITIVGVVRDSRFRSVRKPIEAILFFRDDNGLDVLDVRYSGDPQAVRGRIEALWKRMLPDVLFEAQFGSDIVQRLYRAEDARAQTFAGFAALAVIVACLGLFGLAASPPSAAPRRSACARCSARARATSCGCWCGNSPSRW